MGLVTSGRVEDVPPVSGAEILDELLPMPSKEGGVSAFFRRAMWLLAGHFLRSIRDPPNEMHPPRARARSVRPDPGTPPQRGWGWGGR